MKSGHSNMKSNYSLFHFKSSHWQMIRLLFYYHRSDCQENFQMNQCQKELYLRQLSSTLGDCGGFQYLSVEWPV